MMRLCVAAILSALFASSCNPAGYRGGPKVSMRMHGGPARATVTIDDEYVGPLDVVSARGVALPVGMHRISVESPGFLPWDKMVEAKDQTVRLEVQLVPVPD